MAKTRAQRKAERRAREAQEARQAQAEGRPTDTQAQHDTQVPESGDEAMVKAVEVGMAAGAEESALETPDAPKAPSRAERRRAEKEQREKEKRQAAAQKRREQEKLAKKQRQASDERSR